VTLDVMHDVLSRIRLDGAMFLRAEYTAPWACESPSASELIDLLQCPARRLVLFHIIAEGSCWIRLSRGDYVEARQGDVLVLPYADQHAMGVAEHVSAVPISALLPAPPWHEFPVIRHGGGGSRTSVVCGYLRCEAPMFEPVVKALPPVFIVRPPSGPAADWVNASIQYALDASGGGSTCANMALRLPELLFIEVLRLYVQSGPPELSGWLAALQDPIVGPALSELHGEPARPWTLDELARRAACSRSTLNERFSRLVGRAPMQYLAAWRIQVAAELLQTTRLGVAAVAFRVGYESEAAFNRAFKRAMGKPPAQWRAPGGLTDAAPGLIPAVEDHMGTRRGAARAVCPPMDRG
jgi:AraC-like DNA-binding protein